MYTNSSKITTIYFTKIESNRALSIRQSDQQNWASGPSSKSSHVIPAEESNIGHWKFGPSNEAKKVVLVEEQDICSWEPGRHEVIDR